MKIPVLSAGSVLHIGTLNPADKRGLSYEGHCLSVSRCPHAWRSIARLGGNPLWSLTAERIVFLDALRIAGSKALRRAIEQWAVAGALGCNEERWQAWNTDEEGDWNYSLHETEAAAQAEVADEEGPAGGPSVQRVLTFCGTAELAAAVGVAEATKGNAFDYAALLWAERTQPQIDGVWWQETYDPHLLSAPRGGIFPDRLARLARQSLTFDRIGDDPKPLKRSFLELPNP